MTTDPSARAFSSCSSTRTPPALVRPWRTGRQQEPGWSEYKSALCDHHLPKQASRRYLQQSKYNLHNGLAIPRLSVFQSAFLSFLFRLLFLCRTTHAGQVFGASEVLPRELLFDRSPPPPLPRMLLEKRQDEDSSSILPSIVRASSKPTATESTIQIATETSTTLPRPFDSNIGNNFTTTTCPTFFNDFLSNQTFNDCLPFSLLLQSSNAFFSASRSLVRLTRTLDATCNVNYPQCSTLMSHLAATLQQSTICGPDLTMENPMVLQAYNGLLAYDTLYHAGCLADSSGSYCYANAVTNASAPSSSYVYYLPLGVQLPGGSRPACTDCLQNTMAIFAKTAGNRTQPVSRDYVAAAEQVQMNCGPTFVESRVEMTSAASTMTATPPLAFAGLLTLAILFMNLFV